MKISTISVRTFIMKTGNEEIHFKVHSTCSNSEAEHPLKPLAHLSLFSTQLAKPPLHFHENIWTSWEKARGSKVLTENKCEGRDLGLNFMEKVYDLLLPCLHIRHYRQQVQALLIHLVN
jgi:hypothetical protein